MGDQPMRADRVKRYNRMRALYLIAGLILIGLALWAAIYFWYIEDFHFIYLDAAIIFAIPIGLAWLRWSNVIKRPYKQ